MTTTTLDAFTGNFIGRTITMILSTLKTFGKGFNRYMYTMGRARAAAELVRMGYHEEAKRLMTGEML
tara:strand:+ start:589 stop:789 length:201 start_codon:yes stop_codon:yes gene_type:complete